MKSVNNKTSPYNLGDVVIPVKQSHNILEFIENGKFASCSCGRRHPLNERARASFKNKNPISDFEYCSLVKKFMLTKDIEEILSKIGGLFH